ncbi:MAG: hypothetical protein ACKOEW_00770 [Methylocystis sp.]
MTDTKGAMLLHAKLTGALLMALRYTREDAHTLGARLQKAQLTFLPRVFH